MEQNNFPEIQKRGGILVNQTYSYINNSGFYALANPVCYDYMFRIVRRMSWWLDGYVPDFHSAGDGVISTRFAASLVNGTANQIVGRKVGFKNAFKEQSAAIKNNALDRVSEWAASVDFTNRVRTAVKYCVGLGTSLLKLNKAGSELWVEAMRFDDFFFESDFRGELESVTCLIKSYLDTTPKAVRDDKNVHSGRYYLVEHRYFGDTQKLRVEKGANGINVSKCSERVPYSVFQIHKYTGNITTAQSYDVSLRENVKWGSVPKSVRASILRDYSMIQIGVPVRLPFPEYLGCEILKFDAGDTSLPQLPFGTSILQNIIGYLMGYDLAYSYFVRDMYIGKGSVLVPKPQQQAGTDGSALQGLDSFIYTVVQHVEPDKQKPFANQFDLRASDWTAIRNHIIECVAMSVGMSPATVASFLQDGNAKTAREVSTEEGSTINFVEIQRGVLEVPINRLLKCVTQYMCLADTVVAQFGKAGAINVDMLIDRTLKRFQGGILDLYSAVKETMLDADESQIAEVYNRLVAERKEQAEQRNNSLFGNNEFGDDKFSDKSAKAGDGDMNEAEA